MKKMTMQLKRLLICATGFLFIVSCDHGAHDLNPKLSVGDRVPMSDNIVIDNIENWHQVSTMDTKVPLYSWKIADLLTEGRPFIVVFGTPQHCTMCVDQIVRVAVMEEKFGDRFAFVHIDGYKNNDVWVEWGITGEPWTYVVDAKGLVRNIFPGQTELALLEEAVLELTGDG